MYLSVNVTYIGENLWVATHTWKLFLSTKLEQEWEMGGWRWWRLGRREGGGLYCTQITAEHNPKRLHIHIAIKTDGHWFCKELLGLFTYDAKYYYYMPSLPLPNECWYWNKIKTNITKQLKWLISFSWQKKYCSMPWCEWKRN